MSLGNNDNSRIRFWVLLILLIIIILILLFFSNFGKIQNNYLVPTGNVDVFDIDISCACKKDNTCTQIEDGKEVVIPAYSDKDKETTGRVFWYDNNGEFIYQEKLEIFNNAAFRYRNMIAPGSSNSYYFVLHNSSNVAVNYKIQMYEVSQYPVNLKYRLIRNGEYIIGSSNSWVSVDELQTEFYLIDAKSSDKFYLDWMWPYNGNKDAQDTYAGTNMTEEYQLYIRTYIESVE